MADFSQIIQEINDDITTNGVGAITGAKLNAVLRDMIAAVNAAKTDILPDGALYGGFAWPNEPPTYGDDHRYFYLAFLAGSYPAFDTELTGNILAMFYWLEDLQAWTANNLTMTPTGIEELLSPKMDTVELYTRLGFLRFSPYSTYSVGDYVVNEGFLYVFTSNHPAGQWDEDDVVDASLVDYITDYVSKQLSGKQDTISDLSTIRSGAAAGATAVQPSDLAPVATSGSYNDLLNKPTIPAAFSIVGSFDVKDLPTLDGFNDAGKVAFVKDTRKYATWDGYGWTYMDGKPVTPRYLTFTANEDGSSVGFCCWSEDHEPVDIGKNMQYSTDGGKTWEDYTIGVGEDNLVAIELDEGESVMFRGNNESLAYYLEDDGYYIYTKCFIAGSVAASGDVTSLLNGVGGDATLADFCYSSMFYGCTGLTEAPALPATTLADSCYGSMFYGCTGLTEAPALPVTTLADSCYSNMFQGCTGLTQAPALPATTLAIDCYLGMFRDCTQITSHHVATLNNSAGIFVNNSSCGSFTIDAETPPTIGDNTISGLKADCVIYVPAASVDAYKAANYWSARSAYIQAIP